MKACHAYLYFSIKYAGGTSDLMFKLAKAQIKAGIHPVLLVGNHEFDEELARKLPEAEFLRTDITLVKAGINYMPGLWRQIRDNVKSWDVVHIHAFRTFQTIALYYHCRKHGVPLIMDAHGAVPYHRRNLLLKRLFDFFIGRRILREAALVVAETQVGIDEYLAVEPNIDRDRLVVLSPPFDTDEFQVLPERGAFRREWGIGADEKLIMFLGRIHHIKGNDFLIKGFAELVKRRGDVRLALVGSDDGHMEECKRLVGELGLGDKVVFTGFMSGAKKNQALVDADVVAQMSRQEQGAWAPFEAVLCGTPIIVTGHTGSGEDVRRVDAGETVTFDDTGELADKLGAILDNYAEAKARTMKAKRYIEENMSFNGRIKEYAALYDRAREKVRRID